MGTLNGAIIYLAGPIDAAADDGVKWRRDVRTSIKELGINVKFIDPSDKPRCFRAETSHEKIEIKELKRIGRWKDVAKRVSEFRRHDLRAVDIADALIVYVDHDVHMCGTYAEVNRAELQGKPMFLVVKGGRQNCPPWLFGSFKPENMFDSLADLLERLEEIDHSPLTEDWVLSKDWLM